MAPVEVQVIKAQAEANYQLTPAGQMVQQFATLQRMGQMYASATIVPDTYKGNVGNCAIALDMAQRMGCNPLMVMQNIYIVHGMPSFSTKFLVSCINASKRFSPLRYEFKGEQGKDDYGCRCYAYEAGDVERKEPLYGDWITWAMVKGEGWANKAGSKWKTMPDQMFRYRAAAFWQRLYCPEISMGFLTTEEAYDSAEEISSVATVKRSLSDVAAAAMEEKSEETVNVETGEVQPPLTPPGGENATARVRKTLL